MKCLFANPALKQANDHHEEIPEGPFAANMFIKHSVVVNEKLFLPAVTAYANGSGKQCSIYETQYWLGTGLTFCQ
jgi:hypothetical protein